jgi:hypothetical protein
VAKFTDSDPNATPAKYTPVSINWGDNTPSSPGTVSSTAGTFSIDGSHTYEEEGSYTVTVTITYHDPSNNPVTSTITSTANIGECPIYNVIVGGV